MRRALTASAIAFAAALTAQAENVAPAAAYETDTYRVASPYQSLRGSTPEACAAACERDLACQAWTLTPPTFRIGPRCELKSSPGDARNQPGAVSGLSTPVPHPAAATPPPEPAPPPAPAEPKPAPAPVDVPLKPRPAPDALAGAPQAASPQASAAPPPPQQNVVRRTRERTIVETRTVPGEVPATPAPPAFEAPPATPEAPATVTLEPLPPVPTLRPRDPAPAPSVPTPTPVQPKPAPPRQPPPWVSDAERPALPSPTERGARTYSVQDIDLLPGDIEDSAGIAGRLPSGSGEMAIDDEEESEAQPADEPYPGSLND